MAFNKQSVVTMSLSTLLLSTLSSRVHADHGGLGVGIGIASPIITDSAITLPAGKAVVGERTQFISWDTFSNKQLLDIKNEYGDSPKGDVHSIGSTLNPALFAAYGVTDTLSLGLRIPAVLRYNIRQPNEEGTAVDKLGNSVGFGDIIAFGQWRFWHTQNNATHAALITGVKMPTGMDHLKHKPIPEPEHHDEEESSDGHGHGGSDEFEAHFQPGSGSWDALLGGAFTHGFGQFSFDSSVLYTFATQGVQQTNLGDSFQYNLALSYALTGAAPSVLYAESNAANWVLVGEINGEWKAKQSTRGELDPNTGGNTVYLSPGIRYAGGPNWNVSLSVGIPIVRDAYGFQDNPDYRLVNRISIIF